MLLLKFLDNFLSSLINFAPFVLYVASAIYFALKGSEAVYIIALGSDLKQARSSVAGPRGCEAGWSLAG